MNIFFMHIAKTAGSLVNEVLEAHLGREACLTHCERVIGDPARFSEILQSKRFVSGHVYWNDLAVRGVKDHRLVTVLREPLSHLVSHIRWLDHYNLPEFRQEYHMLDVQTRNVVDIISAVDFADAGSLDSFLQNLPPRGIQYLDNCQSRYFLAGGHSSIGRTQRLTLDMRRTLLKNASAFDLIGLQNRLPRFFQKMGDLLGEEVPFAAQTVNEGRSHRTIDTERPIIREVLTKCLTLDRWFFSAMQRKADV